MDWHLTSLWHSLVKQVGKTSHYELVFPQKWQNVTPEWRRKAAQAAEQNDGHVELRELPDTRLDFYDHVYSSSFEANVLASVALDDSSPSGATHAVVLDCTLFYPEGGGQEADHGQLAQEDDVVNVVDVQKEGGVVVHFTNGPLKGRCCRVR